MVSFGYPKHKQKTFKFAWQPFGTQSLLWIKINFDPTIRWRGLDQINVHTIYNLRLGESTLQGVKNVVTLYWFSRVSMFELQPW